MKTIHYKNYVGSKQKSEDVAKEILTEIFENKDQDVKLLVDNGNGDVWIYEICWGIRKQLDSDFTSRLTNNQSQLKITP